MDKPEPSTWSCAELPEPSIWSQAEQLEPSVWSFAEQPVQSRTVMMAPLVSLMEIPEIPGRKRQLFCLELWELAIKKKEERADIIDNRKRIKRILSGRTETVKTDFVRKRTEAENREVIADAGKDKRKRQSDLWTERAGAGQRKRAHRAEIISEAE